jgi:molybdate transport system permease protein
LVPATRVRTLRDASFAVAAALATATLLALLVLPIAALVLRVPPARLFARMGDPAVLEALRLSLITSLAATLVVVALGLPLAWLLATRRFPGRRVLEVMVDLPMVLPPTVAGLALLLALGRMGLAGRVLSAFGVTLPFTTAAVVVAQVFMAAPFFIAPVRAGLASVERRYLDAAATLRSDETHTFLHVLLPLSFPSLLAGVAMCGARALGEFGATITFAGNLPGVTQTMPLAVYVALQTDLEAAVTLAVLLLIFSAALLLGLRLAPIGPARTRAARPDARRNA